MLRFVDVMNKRITRVSKYKRILSLSGPIERLIFFNCFKEKIYRLGLEIGLEIDVVNLQWKLDKF